MIASLLYGALFALMAMGLTLTYMTTKVPNFAYGSFVTIGVYTAFGLKVVYNMNPYLSSIPAFFIAGVVSVIMYVGVLRPLARRGTPLVALMIATFAVDIGFIGIIGIYTDYMQQKYPHSLPKQFFTLPGDFTLFGVQGLYFVAPAVVAAITLSIYLLFTRTRFGIAMRASVENASLAKVLGINVERVNVVSWMLAGGFAGVAGAFYTLFLPGGTSTGSNLIVDIFAASVLGGLSSIFGAVAGGLIIGSSQDIITSGLGLGFETWGAVVTAVLAIGVGALVLALRYRQSKSKVGGSATRVRVLRSARGATSVVLILFGAYILLEVATNYATDFFVRGLVEGYGPNVTPYQPAVPLLVMVVTLLVLPRGIVSLNLGWFRRRRR